MADKVTMHIAKTMINHPIREVKDCIARLLLIEKDGKRQILLDYTCIVIPKAFRAEVLAREHLSHAGRSKTILDIAAKYYWPGLEKDMKQLVEECTACQTHGCSQKREPKRPALEYVYRPMQSIGLDFFHQTLSTTSS